MPQDRTHWEFIAAIDMCLKKKIPAMLSFFFCYCIKHAPTICRILFEIIHSDFCFFSLFGSNWSRITNNRKSFFTNCSHGSLCLHTNSFHIISLEFNYCTYKFICSFFFSHFTTFHRANDTTHKTSLNYTWNMHFEQTICLLYLTYLY